MGLGEFYSGSGYRPRAEISQMVAALFEVCFASADFDYFYHGVFAKVSDLAGPVSHRAK